jgi:hypothetical protein
MTLRSSSLFAALLAIGLTSCDGAKTGVVHGSVSIDGDAISFGTVAFVGADGRVDQAMIEPDGTYSVRKAPVGEVTITVQTYPLPPQVQPPDASGKAGKPSAEMGGARYVPIPPHYGDAKQSPLKFTVKPGDQTYDLVLTRK